MKTHFCFKAIFLVLALATAFIVSCCRNGSSDGKPISLLIDSDMVESFDDGIAFIMLSGTDAVHILGLTTVTTNVWSQESLAYGIRLGELCGMTDMHYIAGSRIPLREGRLDSIDKEIDANPGEDAEWRGASSYPEVLDWESFYVDRYGCKPAIRPVLTDASEYIAESVMSAPGTVTILAIGACTNIAKALVSHPEMASMAREIIYMGGAVFCPGNTTPYAEMNFLYDPEAAAICLRAPFPKQTVVSLDICNTVLMDRDRFLSIYDAISSQEIRSLISSNFPFPEFQSDPSSMQFVWDLISAAIVVNPSIITEYKDVRIDIDDNPDSPTYGKSFETEDQSREMVRVPVDIDRERFWDIIISGISVF
ncbi:MAG: nucleoside hydrolase [Bacteroidia bacterium]|nr:nucleoside hydrolase [Bacteroidia bacterium]